MHGRCTSFAIVLSLTLILPTVACAGMPSPLPTDYEKVFRLNEEPLQRFQTISFFLMGLLACAAIVRWLWNYLQRDFFWLPRLSFGKALAGVLLWGLLFVIVLTMISGARELMTPGAWRKEGFTYKLNNPTVPATGDARLEQRKRKLEDLRTALLHFAATHRGSYPKASELEQIEKALWQIPDAPGVNYIYVPGMQADQTVALVVQEPEWIGTQIFAMQSNGEIVTLPSSQLNDVVLDKEKP